MSKFRVKLKLQGFELEIEGAREDASLIGRSLGQQVSGMLSPGMAIIEGETLIPYSNVTSLPSLIDEGAKKRSRRRGKPNGSANGSEDISAIDFRHDAAKYGNPSQQWTTQQKSLWLLYVVKEVANIGELSAGRIAQTFNKHFRQAKTIQSGNVTRDLGKAKVATPSVVSEDTTKSPSVWYLTEEGIRRTQAQISEILGQQSTT